MNFKKAIAIGFLCLPLLTSVTPTALANRNSKVCCRCNMTKDYKVDNIPLVKIMIDQASKARGRTERKNLLEEAESILKNCEGQNPKAKPLLKKINELKKSR